jgi:hypothetical protein
MWSENTVIARRKIERVRNQLRGAGGFSAAKLESVGVVMTVITAMTVMKAAGKFSQTETGE